MTDHNKNQTAEYQITNSSLWRAWLIWGLGAIFYFYEFCLQSSPGVMVPDLMKAFQVNASQLGDLSAYYFYAYALMQVPVGILLDRYGPHIAMTIACLVCAVGAYLFSHVEVLWQAQLSRALMGLGSAFAVVSAMKLATLWFPPQRFAVLTGLIVTAGMLGAIGGQVPLSDLVEVYGWRHSMELLSYSGFILAILIFCFVKNGPMFGAHVNQTNQQKLAPWPDVKLILTNRQIWLMALYGGLMFAPTVAFGELWGVPYLISTFGVERTLAAKMVALVFVGWAVGSPLFGYWSDRLGDRLLFMKIGAWGSLIFMLLISLVLHHSIWAMAVALFAFGFISSGFLMVFSLAKESVPVHLAATAVGFINMLNMLLPALLQILIGLLLDSFWDGKTIDGIRIYGHHAYYYASFSLWIVILFAIFFLRSIKASRMKS